MKPVRATSLATRLCGAVVAAAALATMPAPAHAQDSGAEARLRKVEAEIRALQRKVFPGGDGRFFEPQITGAEATASRSDRPSTSALTDILARIEAVELQLQRLTARSEENSNALSLLDQRVGALEGMRGAPPRTTDAATDSNLAAMTGEEEASSNTQIEGEAVEERIEPSRVAAETSAVGSENAGPSPERIAAVQAISKPDTGDAGADEYTYGFRLWDAGFYPEARQQLTGFIEAYPDHRLITYGRNLLGRAFLDDGMAEEAARWFLRNYQADRTARRASDSLLYLAESMIAMNDDRRACIALAEFGETYPAIATGRLADQYESNRRKVTCE